MRPDSVYKSKVDWWIGAVVGMLLLMSVVSLPVGLWYLAAGRVGESVTFLTMTVFMGGILALLVWPIVYTLTADTLIIRYGVIRTRVELATITGAELSNNPLSSPALSLQRLKISHTGKWGMALISPKDRHQFMQDLADRCDHLVYADGTVRMANTPE